MSTPRALLLEPTSRCNLYCSMCPRQTPGCEILEGDLPLALLHTMGEALRHVERVSLAGLGEPLLHPEIIDIISFLRRHMPPSGRIGLQTNGLLLTPGMAEALSAAGLDEICISVDALETVPGQTVHGGASVPFLEEVLAMLRQLRDAHASGWGPLDVGIEGVLMRSNTHALPDLVDWAAGQGAGFLLVSHLLPSHPRWAQDSLANTNSAAAVALFNDAEEQARAQGLTLQDAPGALFHTFYLSRTPAQRQLLEILEEMMRRAREQKVSCSLHSLVRWAADPAMQALPALFAEAQARADAHGLRLHLPALAANDQRECPFVSRQMLCIDAHGNVAPCHYLWHTHVTAEGGRAKQVQASFLGTLGDSLDDGSQITLGDLWASGPARALRDTLLEDDTPRCYDCTAAPCSELTKAVHGDACDCLGGDIPCGHCPWPLGLVACLGTEASI